MAVLLLSSLLLLLPHLVPAKVFLVDTEAISDETGDSPAVATGQDYHKYASFRPDDLHGSDEDGPTNCLDMDKWTKRNDAMEKRQEAREKKTGKKVTPKGHWITGEKGSNRFCCDKGELKGSVVANPGRCPRAIRRR